MAACAFGDGWVVERTLFDHAALGRCECCGGGVAMMAQSPLLLELCTDLDTDDRRKDAQAPFPPCMKADIDRGRLTIRMRLKETIPQYQSLATTARLDDLAAWWTTLPLSRKQSICVMPVAEVAVLCSTQLDLRRGAYTTLLSAVLEQVRRFPETGYAPDGVTEAELGFEGALSVKQGAFVLAPENLEAHTIADLLRFVGGPKLLLPHSKAASEGAASSTCIRSSEAGTGSFRGDRRLLRVVIARYMVDRAVQQFGRAKA